MINDTDPDGYYDWPNSREIVFTDLFTDVSKLTALLSTNNRLIPLTSKIKIAWKDVILYSSYRLGISQRQLARIFRLKRSTLQDRIHSIDKLVRATNSQQLIDLFSRRTLELLKKRGLTESQLGLRLMDIGLPSIDNLIRIATVLNTSIDYLVGRTDEP